MTKIKVWHKDMTDKETVDIAYWERNMLALRFADGWYNDDVEDLVINGVVTIKPRYQGWRRVLSLDNGQITFHIPDDFDVGHLAQIERNWDGHTTEQKWQAIADSMGICLAALKAKGVEV